MKKLLKKPGVILLPVSAVLIIFIMLLVMLIDQKQYSNALILEYKASRVVNLLLDLYVTGEQIDPAEVDENIIGYGIYDNNRNAIIRYGTAPERLRSATGRNNNVVLKGRRSITIIRPSVVQDSKSSGMLLQPHPMPGNMMRRLNEFAEEHEGKIPPALEKYRTGIFLEYGNSVYLSERRLIILIILLFIIFFSASSMMVFKLYRSNRSLLMKTEQDKQLIQLGEAARTLAHEIRNPLGALKLQRDLLSRKLPEQYEGNLEVIDRELKRLNLLVERVGEFLRNPVGRPEEINIGNFAKKLYAGRKDVSIFIQNDTFVMFDSERLRTVFDNIVNNAVESGGAAEIIIGERNRRGFEVLDKGAGFSTEALSRLFDPFFTTKNNGTGLGLSVVKRLVEAAGGRITVSNIKSGASVKISFGDKFENTDS